MRSSTEVERLPKTSVLLPIVERSLSRDQARSSLSLSRPNSLIMKSPFKSNPDISEDYYLPL